MMLGFVGSWVVDGCSLAWADGRNEAMEELVVTATKSKTVARRVTRSVATISAEPFVEQEGHFLADGLRRIPGTFVRRSGQIGRTTSVVIRGSSARQVHVTIDGVHVASPTTGAFDFAQIAPDNLKQIEVLRGAGSVLYGSDAIGGIIHLITRRGEGPYRASYTQEFTSLIDAYREVLSFQGATGPWHLSGGLSRLDANGLGENDDVQNTHISARVGYDFSNGGTVDLFFRHLFSIVGIEDGAFRPDPNRKDRERQSILSLETQIPTTSVWRQTVRVSTTQGNLIDNDPSNGGGDPSRLFKLDTERYAVQWEHRMTPADWTSWIIGTEFEDREGDNRLFSKTQTTWAFYLQHQWIPFDPFTLLAGIRFFKESAFGSDRVAEVSAAYWIAPWNLKLRGGWGEGFRVPTLNELFFPNFGNPHLGPETSQTIELGADWADGKDRLRFSATLFRTDVQDLIQTVNIGGGKFEPRNIGKARMDGVELELILRPWDPLRLSGSYTFLDAGERPSKEELLRIPNTTVGFTVGLLPDHDRWQVSLQGSLVSSREESTGLNRRDKTKGYLTLDLFAHWRWTPWLKAYVRVDNLTDRRYSEVLGFPAQGLTASVGVTVER